MIKRPLLIVVVIYIFFWILFESPHFEASIFLSVFLYHFLGLMTAFIVYKNWRSKTSKAFSVRVIRIFGSSLLALIFKILIASAIFKFMGSVFDISVTRLYHNEELFIKAYRIDIGSYLIFFSLVELALSAPVISSKGEVNNSDHSIKVMFIKSGKEMVSLHSNRIRYVEGLKDYVKIYTMDGVEVVKKTMKGMKKLLPESEFYRIHKSYIINLKQVDRISGNMIMIGKDTIPIGATYKEELLEKLNSSII